MNSYLIDQKKVTVFNDNTKSASEWAVGRPIRFKSLKGLQYFGPCFVVIYINYLECGVNSNMILYTDDTTAIL